MKRTILIAICALFFVQQVSAAGWIKELPLAQKRARETKRLIFVDLYADWCGWCKHMEQEVFPSQVFQSATDNMVLLRLNTEDGGDGSNFAKQFDITSLPTFLVLTDDLTIAGIIRGYAPANEFVGSLRDVQTKYGEFVKKSQSEQAFGKDYDKRLDFARELASRHAFTQSEMRLKALMTEKGVPPTIRDSAYYELGVSQLMQHRYPDALVTIRKLNTLSKKGEPVERSRILLGEVYLRQGNLMAAATEFRNFKTSFPNSPLVKNVDLYLPEIERELSASKK